MSDLSVIVLTFNEEIHLERVLEKVRLFTSEIYVVDSFSSDGTIKIADRFGAKVLCNAFENHSLQWQYALQHCDIKTPWVVALDADQYPSQELINKLQGFRDADIPGDMNGIYFNRHNYFQGKRLKYGGYRNFYMLKMFRYGKGFSDTNEKMDHRFVTEGKTIVWKDAVLIEDNLKEYDIDFWLTKHIRYSKQVAGEEWERRHGSLKQTITPRLFGNPDELKALFKAVWWKLPLFVRPHLYFFYRFFLQLGFLESREGRIFHFLQAYWFRLLVDYRLYKYKGKRDAKS
jgi:glycosyltransferase involved in cell wall biosynthesis